MELPEHCLFRWRLYKRGRFIFFAVGLNNRWLFGSHSKYHSCRRKITSKNGAKKTDVDGLFITGLGILLTSFTFLLAKEYIIVAFVGFTLFGVGLGFYATPSTDAAFSNVPGDKAGSASGIYKMASSLGAALGVAISAAIFYGLQSTERNAADGRYFYGKD